MENRLVKLKQLFNNPDNRSLANNIIISFFIKGLAMVLAVFMTPAYIKYFNNQAALGIWFTLISIFTWILNFDLGIGNGLRNKLVKAFIDNDNKKIQEYISSAYILMGFISVIVICVGIVVIRLIDWNNVLNISNSEVSNSCITITVIIIFAGIIIQFWLKLITSILYAMQKTALPSLVTFISSLLIFCYIVFFKTNDVSTNLVNLALVQVFTINIPLIIISIITFSRWINGIWPSIKNFRWDYAKSITSLGGTFFVIQISLMVISSSNEILITKLYSPKYTVEYQIYYKWFSLAVVLFSLITQPMWSAFTKAFEEKRYVWIFKVYKIFNILALIGTCGCILLAIYFQPIINLWLGSEAIITKFSITLNFVAFSACMMFINASTSVANGCSKLKCQLLCTLVGAFLKVFLSVVFSRYFDSWYFIMLTNVVALIPLVIIQPIITHRILKQAINNGYID